MIKQRHSFLDRPKHLKSIKDQTDERNLTISILLNMIKKLINMQKNTSYSGLTQP